MSYRDEETHRMRQALALKHSFPCESDDPETPKSNDYYNRLGAGKPLPAGCLNQLAECACCAREQEDIRLVHSVRGDDCTGHALLCGACAEAQCWPGDCEKPKADDAHYGGGR